MALRDLTSALTPDAARLPEEARAKVIADYGTRQGEKSLRAIAEHNAQPYQVDLVARLIGEGATAQDLRRAASGKKRTWILYQALLQIDHPLAEGMIREALKPPPPPPPPPELDLLVQVIPNAVRPLRFAPELRMFAMMGDAPQMAQTWSHAVRSLGKMRDEGACLMLMEQVDDTPKARALVWALREIGSSFAEPVYWDVLGYADRNARVQALWALANLGVEDATLTLVALLDDPDLRTETSSRPGLSRRAAQALADIHGWDFEWSREGHAQVAEAARANYNGAQVAAALARRPEMAGVLTAP